MAVPSLSIKRLTSKWEKDLYYSSPRLLAVLGDTDIVSFVAVAQHFGGERHKKWTSKAGESKKQLLLLSF